MTDNPNYSYVGTVKTPDGATHYLKDAEARTAITSAEGRLTTAEGDITTLKEAVKGGTHFLGKTTTALTDRCTTNPITVVSGETTKSVTAKAGDFTVLEETQGTATVGLEFLFDGTCWTELGSTGTLGTLAYKDSASGKVTPTGTVSKPTATVTPTKESIDHLTATVDTVNETLILGKVSKEVVKAVAVDVSQPAFAGDEKTVTVS